jgi:hypothetical protein
MANKYWAAGVSGNWNDILSWSDFAIGTPAGAAVPGASDAVFFNAASGTVTATLDISPDIQTLTMTGFTGTLAFGTNTISLNSTGTIFTGATTMTVTGTPLIICTDSSATARTITPGVVTEVNSISFRITAGTGTLGLTAGSYRNLDFTDGVNPTGYGGALTGSTSISIYGDLKASTNMTVGAGSGTFTFAATSGTKTINTAGVTFDKPFTFNGVGGTWQLQDALTSGDSRTCTLTNGTLDLNGYTLTTGIFSSSNSNTRVLAFGTGNITLTGVSTTIFNTTTVTGMTITGTPVVDCTATTGTSVQTRTFIAGAHGESQSISVNINPGTSAVDIFRLATNSGAFKDVTFSSTFTGTIQISNSVIIYGNFDSGGTTVYIGPTVITFAATSGTKTISTSGLAIDAPITFNGVGGTWQLQDALTSGATRTTTLTNGTLDLNGNTLTTGIFSSNNANARTLDFGDVFGNIVITGNNTTVFNTNTATNLTIVSFGGQKIIFDYAGGVGTRIITGASIATAIQGTNLLDYLVGSGSDIITLTGNCAYNDVDFDAAPSTFIGTLTNSAIFVYNNFSLSSGMTLTAGANAWTFKNTSMFMSSGIILTNLKTIDNPIIFDGIGGSWLFFDALTLGSTRSLTFINGTIRLFAGTTNTVGSFATSGTNAKYLLSTTLGTAATISAASGTNTVSYLTIQDSYATGGATWDALAITNVDAGNNTGWLFSTTPSIGNEITMRLRSFTQPRRF